MTREAFELSERLGLPALVRLVTRLSHSRATVVRRPPVDLGARVERRGDPNDWTLLPPNARRRNHRLINLQGKLLQLSERSAFNELALRGPKGILACGIAYNYVREVIGDASSYSVLKIGTYPVPSGLVRELVDHCAEILVVEEGYPLVEAKLTGLLGAPGKVINGKRNGALPADGELTADIVRKALGMEPRHAQPSAEPIPQRPPSLCQGCPHGDTFQVLVDALDPKDQPILFGDIGCYTLGAYPPYNAVHTCVDMGASIGMALGAARAGAHPVICTIGDSTFTHSGMAPLLSAAHDDANMTVILLDNSAVAMTGCQEVFMTGDAFIRLLRGLGVDERHIVQLDPVAKEHARNVELMRQEIGHRGLSVVIACRPCIHLKRRTKHDGSTEPNAHVHARESASAYASAFK